MTFAVECKQLHLNKADGAHLTTMFWGVIIAQRLVSIKLLSGLSDGSNIMLSLGLALIGSFLLVSFGCTSVLVYIVLSSVLIISLIFSLMTLVARRKFKHRE